MEDAATGDDHNFFLSLIILSLVYNENVLFNVLRKEGFGTLKQGTNGNYACLVFPAIAVSRDHKPDQTDERQRIEDAGGFVTWAGTWRVGGVLAVSREFGDILLKQYVVADPEIQEEIIDGSQEFLILASDGLWDIVTNEVYASSQIIFADWHFVRCYGAHCLL
ncbi:probable protein phosphatase 2C 45 [Asparagus officinalis]|uniref:probable protein phosphatase 2C 45 n=1 Tax=Asparagus officinalis TaxID=4686 RepID=UPI00098E31E5|nr:probable protein phosphatase 2C 45 [Asparagus officinalis]